MRYLLAELLCIVIIAVGLGLWIAPGAGLFVGGSLCLVLVVVAQLPTRKPGDV